MTVTPNCKDGRDEEGVEVDVNGKQEFLRYKVCVNTGVNDAIIVDQDDAIILDEDDATSAKCRQRDWPEEGETVEDGDHEHVLVLSFIRSFVRAGDVTYTYQVTLHNEDGSIKEWVKDCTYTATSKTDHATIGLSVSVL